MGEISTWARFSEFLQVWLFLSVVLDYLDWHFTLQNNAKKEIGLRKVNGSGIGQIVWLLTTDFTKLIIIASVIACPISYYLMHRWLESFAYRTVISWWIFAVTILLSCLVALATIGYQSYKAATTNPVNTLRAE